MESNFFAVILVLVIVWIGIIIYAFINLFKREDISMLAKVFWAIVIFSAPVLGLILYFILSKSNRHV